MVVDADDSLGYLNMISFTSPLPQINQNPKLTRKAALQNLKNSLLL